jgi:hypothetical protein
VNALIAQFRRLGRACETQHFGARGASVGSREDARPNLRRADEVIERDAVRSSWLSAAWPLAAHAQQAAKSYRMAYLALLGDQDAAIVKQRLNQLGYTEGKNLISAGLSSS